MRRDQANNLFPNKIKPSNNKNLPEEKAEKVDPLSKRKKSKSPNKRKPTFSLKSLKRNNKSKSLKYWIIVHVLESLGNKIQKINKAIPQSLITKKNPLPKATTNKPIQKIIFPALPKSLNPSIEMPPKNAVDQRK